MVRVAFTLIELIFAIVIIGFTVLTLPMMTQVTAKGIDDNLVQEAIFAAATELNQAVTAHWDESSFDINATNNYSKVIHTGDCNWSTKLRPGHINQPLHRRCTETNSSVSNAKVNANISSLDDMEHGSRDIFQNAVPSSDGYKKAYQSTLKVAHTASFGTLTNSKDIKKITISISDEDGPVTQLHSYSTNIGEIDYHPRSF